jgi:phospholipid/cholesterol/gamma-HCH transport system permease protein
MLNSKTFYIENIGDKTINFFVSIFDALKITLISVLYLFLPTSYKTEMRETLIKQIYFTSIQPLALFLFLAFLFGSSILGAIIGLAVQYNLQDKVGLIIIKFSINEYAPFFTALFMALNSSAYINAKLMQMKLNKEFENTQQSSLSTLVNLLLPRVLSGILSALCLGMLAVIIVILSGYIFTLFYLNMELSGYIYTLKHAIDANDFIVFIVKSVLFGFLSMFLPVYLAFRSKNKTKMLANSVLNNVLKLLVALFFIEVLSFVIQSL